MTLTVDDSYKLGSFRDNDDSLRRLKAQASVVLDLEIEQMQAAGLNPNTQVMDLGAVPGSFHPKSHCVSNRAS